MPILVVKSHLEAELETRILQIAGNSTIVLRQAATRIVAFIKFKFERGAVIAGNPKLTVRIQGGLKQLGASTQERAAQ